MTFGDSLSVMLYELKRETKTAFLPVLYTRTTPLWLIYSFLLLNNLTIPYDFDHYMTAGQKKKYKVRTVCILNAQS